MLIRPLTSSIPISGNQQFFGNIRGIAAHKCSFPWLFFSTQSAFTYSKLTIETIEEGAKYVQS